VNQKQINRMIHLIRKKKDLLNVFEQKFLASIGWHQTCKRKMSEKQTKVIETIFNKVREE
jgi:hypothetical protein